MTEKKSNLPKDLQEAADNFDKFDAQIKALTLDEMNKAPVKETAPQYELSQQELEAQGEIFLKPSKSIGCQDKFNEKFRGEMEFATERVKFIAENTEIPGETIEVWTRPFGGLPAQFWEVPVGKVVWGPRHLAEQLKKAHYHRMKTLDVPTASDRGHQFYGCPVVDHTIQRLDAKPVSNNRKSIFMGMGV